MRRVKFLVGILLACVCFCSACGSTNPDRDKPIDQPEVIEYMESDDLNEARAGIYNKFAIPEGNRLKLPDIFGDNMIVQRDKPIRVWGVAPAGEKVTVRLRESGTGKSVVARGVYACENNTFLVELPALQVSEKVYELVVECGASQRKFENVLVGEVILASGQSNMPVALCETYEWEEIAEQAKNDRVRFYVPGVLAAEDNQYEYCPQLLISRGTTTGWVLGNDATFSGIGAASAVAYSAAIQLYELFRAEGKNIPVGVLSLPVGGTGIAAWIPRYTAEEDKDFKRVLSSSYLPFKEDGSKMHYTDFSALFNYKIAPVVNYNIGGVLWYQGETDAGNADLYREALERLIVSWGTEFRFEEGAMPIVMCQLAPFNTGAYENTTTAIVAFNRVFSENAAKRPQTRSAVAIYDCRLEYKKGDEATIHTRYKKEVGERMGKAYYDVAVKNGAAPQYRSPQMLSVTASGNKLLVKFSSAGTGLTSSNGLPLTGFAVAGEDETMYAAEAEVVAPDTVEVYSRHVQSPRYCAYAYSSLNMQANLVNGEGQAALPFVYSKNELPDAKNYCQHDYLACDRLQVWRYFPVRTENGQMVYEADYAPLYRGTNCTFSLNAENALRGNCLNVIAEPGAILSVPLNYPYDVHQFNRFETLSVCVKGDLSLREVSISSGKNTIVLTPTNSETAGNGYTRYLFSLHNVALNGIPDENYRYAAWLDSIDFSLDAGNGFIDEMELF